MPELCGFRGNTRLLIPRPLTGTIRASIHIQLQRPEQKTNTGQCRRNYEHATINPAPLASCIGLDMRAHETANGRAHLKSREVGPRSSPMSVLTCGLAGSRTATFGAATGLDKDRFSPVPRGGCPLEIDNASWRHYPASRCAAVRCNATGVQQTLATRPDFFRAPLRLLSSLEHQCLLHKKTDLSSKQYVWDKVIFLKTRSKDKPIDRGHFV